jgi:muramoyltetrapeptide carboxypeptidase
VAGATIVSSAYIGVKHIQRRGYHRNDGRRLSGCTSAKRDGILAAVNEVASSNIVKPPALGPGDTIGVVAPAAAVDREHLERGVNALTAMGYRVKVSGHVLDRTGILAGTDAVRAAELAAFFRDPETRAIFAARGGYGCGRLLPLLDFNVLARTPKIFLGFSDETYLLNALVEKSRIVAFHGPMVAMDFARGLSGPSFAHLRRLLANDVAGCALEARATLRPGVAEGELIGGCLSVIVAMIGTPWQPAFDGRILFLEDTGEKAYRVDRMLTQLQQAGLLRRVAGVVFGAIDPVRGDGQERSLIEASLAELTADLDCPVLAGIEAGHGSENFTLPFGLRVRLDGGRRRLIFTEPAVMT